MKIPRIEFPELFFGFVAPIGADNSQVLATFRSYFEGIDYRVIDIKVTDIFPILKPYISPEEPLETFPPQKRYHSYIKYGDQLRKEFGDDAFLAITTIARLIRKRQKLENKFERTIFLLHQFKRREEIELLRSVYGESFFQVSIYSRRGARVETLAKKFASGQSSSNVNAFRAHAEVLVQIDENEDNDVHGQQVGRIFHDADFIVNTEQYSPSVKEQINRFCELIFGSNRVSPTKFEHGMFLAKGAALRSLDISRQVGACIIDGQGQIICLGANEVPKATGGTYWSDGPYDDRDYKRGYDSNESRKREILAEIAAAFGNKGKMEDLLKNPKIKESQLMDALEYSRVIHAEMNAICDAARLGRGIQDSTLFCTTFPCHLCAKHIVAAGIKKVIFLEPYPKSLATQLNEDSLQVEGGDRGSYMDFPAVQFNHFYGVTPRRYQEFFQRGRRKNSGGKFVDYRDDPKHPLIGITSPFYAQPEGVVLDALKNAYKDRPVDETAILEA